MSPPRGDRSGRGKSEGRLQSRSPPAWKSGGDAGAPARSSVRSRQRAKRAGSRGASRSAARHGRSVLARRGPQCRGRGQPRTGTHQVKLLAGTARRSGVAAERRSGGAQDARTTQRCQRLVSTKGSTQKQAGEALTMFAPVSGARRRPERCVCPRGGCPGGVPKSSSKRQKGPAIGPGGPKNSLPTLWYSKIHWVNRAILHFLTTAGREGKPEKLR